MATSKEYIEFVQEQLAEFEGITVRKMFGEYMVYAHGRAILLVCDDTVLVKKRPEVAAVMRGASEGLPYEGAKPHYLCDIEDRALLRRLVPLLEATAPPPRKRKPWET